MNRKSRYSCFAILCACSIFANAQDVDTQRVDNARISFLNGLAKEHALSEIQGRVFTISSDSLLNYSNPGQSVGAFVGTTLVWLERELPIAVCCFSMRVPDERVYYEFVSLVDRKMECHYEDVQVWAPTTRDTNPQVLRDIVPIQNSNRRLVQMRGIARQFEAYGIDRDPNQKNPFRLLPQPIYRYQDPETGVVDGALFAFAVSNDPELLLQLEAVKNQETGSILWRYNFARMTSWRVVVSRGEDQVWEVPNFYLSGGRRPQRPYFEGKYGYHVEGEMRPTPARSN